MKHLGTQHIETERLILRKFVMDDANAMFEHWASDDEVTRFLSWPTHESVAVTTAVLGDWTANYEKFDYYQWAIVLKETGPEPIGSIAVVSLDDKVKKAEIGYCIGRSWWHKGITAEALQAVIDFLITKVGMQRIEASHDSRNVNSGAVMRKCGMQYEGTMRRSKWNNQGVCDTCYYSVLSTDR